MKMSFAAAHESKRVRRVCQRCRERKARFRYRGVVRSDRNHTLCFECHRSALNHRRSQQLASNASNLNRAPQSPFRPAALTPRGIAHRSRMLEQLERAAGK
jgi:hypothetical protein